MQREEAEVGSEPAALSPVQADTAVAAAVVILRAEPELAALPSACDMSAYLPCTSYRSLSWVGLPEVGQLTSFEGSRLGEGRPARLL